MLGIAPSPDPSPKITIVDICPPYLPNTNQGVVSMITVFGGWAGVVGQMSDHRLCLGIRVCRDKISCPPQQFNGGCVEGY